MGLPCYYFLDLRSQDFGSTSLDFGQTPFDFGPNSLDSGPTTLDFRPISLDFGFRPTSLDFGLTSLDLGPHYISDPPIILTLISLHMPDPYPTRRRGLGTRLVKYLMIRRFVLLSLVLAVLWLTKMRSLAGSLADGVLAEAILIPPRPPIPLTNIRRGRGRRKSTETKKRKEEMLGWLNASLKCMETRQIPIPANFKMPVSD